jgi:hypothetical protein
LVAKNVLVEHYLMGDVNCIFVSRWIAPFWRAWYRFLIHNFPYLRRVSWSRAINWRIDWVVSIFTMIGTLSCWWNLWTIIYPFFGRNPLLWALNYICFIILFIDRFPQNYFLDLWFQLVLCFILFFRWHRCFSITAQNNFIK